jgi:hypothetical protein
LIKSLLADGLAGVDMAVLFPGILNILWTSCCFATAIAKHLKSLYFNTNYHRPNWLVIMGGGVQNRSWVL